MLIKICGMTDLGLVKLAASRGADMLGFILVPTSPRYCSPVFASEAIEWLRACAPLTKSVVVLVTDDPNAVQAAYERLRPDYIQLHTSMSAQEFNQMKVPRLIKAFSMRGPMKESDITDYQADYYLFDAYKQGQAGGTGQSFDWDWIPAGVRKMSMIAGGIRPEDIPVIAKKYRPYAIDLNSKLERRRGQKSPARIEKALRLSARSV